MPIVIAIAFAAFALSTLIAVALTYREVMLRRVLREALMVEGEAERLISEHQALQTFDHPDGRYFEQILAFDLLFPVKIVISRHRRTPADPRRFISVEDLKAMECLLRMRPDILAHRVISELLVPPDQLDLDESRDNLVLFGSPESNATTGQVLS
ncbi:MAG: hypothetical protein ACREP9_01730, partial [Candidatus Dormibacteraceae bacterium]